MTVIHLKKKDVVKSSVKGVAIEFDHDRLASILGVPGKNGICEYIKDVWEESKYTKPLEITRRFANNETLTAARRVKSEFGVPLVDKKGEEQSDMTILRRLSSPCASRQERMVFGGLEPEKTEEEMMWLMLRKKRMRKKEEIESNLIGRSVIDEVCS
ncbi:hypothetical protein Dimus_025199 [Dionaea muscipula]